MEADQVCDDAQRSLGIGFPLEEPTCFSREELSNKLSQIWTKRQNPEWKPRRASVATCQQQKQQQQQIMAQHHGSKTTYQFNLAGDSIKELILQRRLQHYQQQQNDMIDRCAHDAVTRKLEDLDINCDNSSRKAVQKTVSQVSTNSIVNLETQSDTTRTRLSSAASVSIDSTATAITPTYSKSDGRLVLEGSECELNHDSSTTSTKGEVGRTVSKLNETGNQKLRDSPTCCTDLETETVASESKKDCALRNTLTSDLNEKLQKQDKQRQHVILSMALKQMMTGHNSSNSENKFLVGQDCRQCSCRSRSCSISSVRMPVRTALAASALTLSRSVMFGDGSRQVARQDTESAVDGVWSHESFHETMEVGLQDPSQDEDSFVTVIPQPKRRYSAAFEHRIQEDKNILRPQSSVQQHQQARNSVGENIVSESTMRQIVTSKSSPECEHYPDNGHQCYEPIREQFGYGQGDSNYSRPNSTPDQWNNKTRTGNDVSRRSCSALSRGNSSQSQSSSNFPDRNDINLEALIVESWLDDHPDFTHDYIRRKATRQVVDEWLVANAKVSNTNLSSQVDLIPIHPISRPVSQISLGGYLRDPLWKGAEFIKSDIDEFDTRTATYGSLRANRSNSQSASVTTRAQGLVTPIRKISATDFETRTGSGFLRPMLSKTPDGRLTFLPQPTVAREQKQSVNVTASKAPACHQSNDKTSETSRSDESSVTIGVDHMSNSRSDTAQDDKNEEVINKTDEENEVKLIFELVKNIYDDLDIRTLLHKILKNIAVLINADRSSLFLVCGGPGDPNRRLVSQLFNVDQDSIEVGEPEESITIPWGTGLVGFVAASGEAVNITDCYEDPRFTDAIDQRTGYVTKHMLCAPILDKRNDIVGVAQVINKRDGNAFSQSDELKFMRYLQFCGIGLRNAQSYEQCQLENRRNQVLLDLARMVFEEQSTIEQVVYRIMLHTQSLLDCERCQVLLIDDGNDELENLHQMTSYRCPTLQTNEVPAFRRVDKCSQYLAPSKERRTKLQEGQTRTEDGHNVADSQQTSPKLFSLVFDLECDGNDPVIHNRKEEDTKSNSTKTSRAFPVNIGITGYVALTGETLNIENAHKHERFDVSVDDRSEFKHKSILCMPIRNGQRQIIGVIQLINKKNGQPFNKNDEDLFEAFAIFCGLGIHNTLMYERVLKVMAKQRVTFEVLSYHATAPLEEAKKLSLEQVPSCFALNLASLKFNDFSLDEQYMLKSCLRFFLDLDLIRRFQIDQLVFCNWILSVQKNYRKVTYHPIVGKCQNICRDMSPFVQRTNRDLFCPLSLAGGDGLKASPVRYHNWRHAFNVSQMMFAILVVSHNL